MARGPILQHWPHPLATVLRREPQPFLGVGVEKEPVVQRVAIEKRYIMMYSLQNMNERLEAWQTYASGPNFVAK
jgi:uncharacterized protein (DUF2249 family)